MLRAVSDEYLEHTQIRMTALRQMAEARVDTLPDQVAQTTEGLLDHYNLALPGDLAARRRLEILRQADELLSTASIAFDWETYGSPGVRGSANRLASSLCGDGQSAASSSECDAIRRRANALNAAYETKLETLRSEASRSRPLDVVWQDTNGIAFGGRDPVSCSPIDAAFAESVFSDVAEAAPESGETVVDENAAWDSFVSYCEFYTGSMRYAAGHGGAIWLFTSPENRDLFLKNPANYWPRLGGYGTQAVASGELVVPTSLGGTRYQGGLYVMDVSELDFSIFNAETVERADRNWSATLRERARSVSPQEQKNVSVPPMQQAILPGRTRGM
jgi:hypothetical protein